MSNLSFSSQMLAQLVQENQRLREENRSLQSHLHRQQAYLDNFQYGQYFECARCQIGVDDRDENAVHLCNCDHGMSLCRECFETMGPYPRVHCSGCRLLLCMNCQSSPLCWDCQLREKNQSSFESIDLKPPAKVGTSFGDLGKSSFGEPSFGEPSFGEPSFGGTDFWKRFDWEALNTGF